MDPKDTKSSHPKASHHEVAADTDSTLNQSYPTGTKSSGEPKPARPGESIMKSDDPATAVLRAWAQDKQTQVPGSNGSFATGQLSMGVGAFSGGPLFLPRKEYVVEPPYHSTDHGPVEMVKHEEDGEGGEGKKKKKRSISNLFKRKGGGKSESDGET